MKSKAISILPTALIAATLDGTAAVVFLANMNFAAVWKFVASGFFGSRAFTAGNEMIVYGLLFHFTIALFWTIVYYLFLRNVAFFRKNIIVGGLIYGIVVWLVMNLIVLPFTNIPQSQHTIEGIAKGMVILMVCIGLPIAALIQKQNRLES